MGGVTLSTLIKAILPISFSQYWFFTVYLLLFFLSPFINVMVEALSKRQHLILVLILMISCVIKPTILPFANQYDSTEGMGIISFITLYVLGSYLGRYHDEIKQKKILLLASVLVIFVSKIAIEVVNKKMGTRFGSGIFYHYNTLFQVVNCVLLLYIFKNISVKPNLAKIVTWISSSTFGVYLQHEHPLGRVLLWSKVFNINWLSKISFIELALIMLVTPIAVLIIGTLIDKLRSQCARKLSSATIYTNLRGKIDFVQNRMNYGK